MDIALPRLHVILDPDLCRAQGRDPLALARELARSEGAIALHLRGPQVVARDLWELGAALRAYVTPPHLLVVNDRLDVALACGAGGAHLGGRSLPLSAARAIIQCEGTARLLLGCSVHSAGEAHYAARDGADYLIAGTVYPTASHPDGPAGGPELIRSICTAVPIPVIAIGGITRDNAAAVLRAGAHGIAVMRAVIAAPDPCDALAAFHAVLHAEKKEREGENSSDSFMHREEACG